MSSSRPALKKPHARTHARNSSKEPLRAFPPPLLLLLLPLLLLALSPPFSLSFFFITRELKIETGLDRDPEIDRGASLL